MCCNSLAILWSKWLLKWCSALNGGFCRFQAAHHRPICHHGCKAAALHLLQAQCGCRQTLGQLWSKQACHKALHIWLGACTSQHTQRILHRRPTAQPRHQCMTTQATSRRQPGLHRGSKQCSLYQHGSSSSHNSLSSTSSYTTSSNSSLSSRISSSNSNPGGLLVRSETKQDASIDLAGKILSCVEAAYRLLSCQEQDR